MKTHFPSLSSSSRRTTALARRPFADAAIWWEQEASHALDLSAKTRRSYNDVLRLHVIPVIGEVHLKAMRPFHVGRVFASMTAQGLSPSYQHCAHKAISHVFKAAIANGARLTNPTLAVPAPRGSMRDIVVPDRDAVLAMIELAGANERLRTFVMLGAYSGLRVNEILGLRWSDVRMATRTIIVRRGKGGKTRAAGMPEPLAAQLFLWRIAQRADLGTSPEWVIARNCGTRWDAQGWRRKEFAPLAKRTCPGATPHSLRHSYATFLLEEGVPMRVVSDALGHASTRTTEQTYAHVTARLLAQADDAIVRALPVKPRHSLLIAA